VQSGNLVNVRGQVAVPVTTDEVSVRDWEVPLNIPVQYSVFSYDSAGNQIGSVWAPAFTVTWTQCEAWLVDLARPTNSLPVEIVSFTELTFDIANGVHRVLGRRPPVVTTLPAYTPAGELDVLTETLVERDQVRNILGSGLPFLLRTTPDLGIGNMYLAVTQFVEVRLMQLGDRPQRQWRISVVQVERPDPSVIVPTPPNTYQNVKDTYATYADLLTAVQTYDGMLYTYTPGQVSPIQPWPPDDV
jgi:hypothetical protein